MQIVEGSAAVQVGACRPGRYAGALAFAAYFLVLLLLGVLVHSAAARLDWGMSAAEITANSQFSDPGSFLKGAQDIARFGWVTPDDYWLIHLWPPGFMLLEGGLLRALGETSPLLIPLWILAALCGAGWMLLLRRYLLPVFTVRIASLAPLVPFLFPVVPFVLVSPVGLAFGETFSISFFISGFLLILLARRSGSWGQAAAAGVMLALSAYFRSQFEVLVLCLTVSALLLLAAAGIALLLKRRPPVAADTLRVVVLAVVVAHVAMLPWRWHNYRDSGKAAWVQTSAIIARNSLTPEAELLRVGGRFVVEGGGHLACKLEPSFCGQTDKKFFYRAFFLHPGAWMAEKVRRLPTYWFAPPLPTSMTTVRDLPSTPQFIANLLLLACIGGGMVRLWQIRRAPEFAVQAWFQLSFYAGLAGVYTLAHFEARYFYLPKIFGVVALLTLLPAAGVQKNPRNEVNR